MSKTKPIIVNFVRHVRPPSRNDFTDPLRGLTILFELNYEVQTVAGWISCCNGENFVKSEGIRRSWEKKDSQYPDFVFRMKGEKGGISDGGVVQDLLFSDEFDKLKPIYKEILYDTFGLGKGSRAYFNGLLYDENGRRKPDDE